MSEIREFLNKVKKESYTVEEWDDACRIKLAHSYIESKFWIQVLPCGGSGADDYKLHGNGAKFAYREALRAAKRLHMVTDETPKNNFFRVRITTNKDVKRLEELWKYLTGKRFNERILNNGWWE
nr:hypothetical protein [uncultured Lachnoclostridium sp.]